MNTEDKFSKCCDCPLLAQLEQEYHDAVNANITGVLDAMGYRDEVLEYFISQGLTADQADEAITRPEIACRVEEVERLKKEIIEERDVLSWGADKIAELLGDACEREGKTKLRRVFWLGRKAQTACESRLAADYISRTSEVENP